jgi:hypothetical protein
MLVIKKEKDKSIVFLLSASGNIISHAKKIGKPLCRKMGKRFAKDEKKW